MGKGTGFGKTILIGDQFVLYGVFTIVASAIEKQGYGIIRATLGRK